MVRAGVSFIHPALESRACGKCKNGTLKSAEVVEISLKERRKKEIVDVSRVRLSSHRLYLICIPPPGFEFFSTILKLTVLGRPRLGIERFETADKSG